MKIQDTNHNTIHDNNSNSNTPKKTWTDPALQKFNRDFIQNGTNPGNEVAQTANSTKLGS